MRFRLHSMLLCLLLGTMILCSVSRHALTFSAFFRNIGAMELFRAAMTESSASGGGFHTGNVPQIATSFLQIAYDMNPASQQTRRLLATLYLWLGDYDNVLQFASWNGPGSLPDERLVQLWDISYRQLHPEDSAGKLACEAIEGLNESLSNIPEWAVLWTNAEHQWLSGDLDIAIVTYRKALYHRYELSERSAIDFERIRHNWAQRQLSGHPENSEVLFQLGKSCRRLTDTVCATQAFDQLMSQFIQLSEDQQALVQYYLGMSAYKAGRDLQALEKLKDTFRLGVRTPDLLSALMHLDSGFDISMIRNPTIVLDQGEKIGGDHQLLGYDMLPWNDISRDAQVEIVLFWSVAEDDWIPPSSSDWLGVGEGIWLQHKWIWNLAPDPGFEWKTEGPSKFPYDYSGVYKHSSEDVDIVPDDDNHGRFVQLANRARDVVGIRSGRIPVLSGYLYLLTVDMKAAGPAAKAGYEWYGRNDWMPPLRYEYPLMVLPGSKEWNTYTSIAVPVDGECVLRSSLINFQSNIDAGFDNLLLLPISSVDQPSYK